MSFSDLIRKVHQRFGVGVQRVYLYRITKEQPAGTFSLPVGIQVSLMTADQISLLRLLRPSLSVPEMQKRFQNGDLCYGAFRGEELVHCTWVQSSGRHRILRAGLRKEVRPSQFWIYECWTSETARGLGIYPYVVSRAVRDQFERGLNQGWIYTTPHNLASQRGITKAGFQHVQTLRSIRIAGRYIAVSSKLPEA